VRRIRAYRRGNIAIIENLRESLTLEDLGAPFDEPAQLERALKRDKTLPRGSIR
jgi:hypothetical protein